jgi:HlyD family secretion protein
LKKLKGLDLAPGMLVEAFFSTGSQTILSYLVKPLADQRGRFGKNDSPSGLL